MNNHQNTIFHQFGNFLKTPLALLDVDLKNAHVNKICHFANHLYLCKGLNEMDTIKTEAYERGLQDTDILQIIAVLARDKVLLDLGREIKEVDKHDPNKG